MNFEQTGLPDHIFLRKAFSAAAERMTHIYGSAAEDNLAQIVTRVRILHEALSPEVFLKAACAQLLSFLDTGSYAFDNIRHDYDLEIFHAVKELAYFQPAFEDPGFLGEILKDRDTPQNVRLIYMASTIAGLRYITDCLETMGDDLNEAEIDEFVDAYRAIAGGCAGVNTVLDMMYIEELQRLHNARNHISNPPRFPATGAKPTLQ
jgi:hypothetical protein